jgi:cytochrome c oxidase cbb3-type subunit III
MTRQLTRQLTGQRTGRTTGRVTKERTGSIMKAYLYKRLLPNSPILIVFILVSLGLTSNLSAQDSGKPLYQFYCAQCHGEKGDGKGINATEDLPTQPKDFTSPKNLPVFSDQQITNTITQGGPKEQLSFIMPPWGNLLSAEEIETLRAHLREICQCQFDPQAAAKAKAEQEKQAQ